MTAAPDAVYRRPDGLVIIDPKAAVGNRQIVNSCPYGVIYYNAELELAQKCTGCAHLIDAGWEKPRCVTACPTDALTYVEEDELTAAKLYAPLERLNAEFGTEPHGAYVNLPKPFIAGAVYSPNEDICLEGVNVKVELGADGTTQTTKTNFLGEFSIGNLAPGFYTIYFEKDGYAPKRIAKLDANKALNVDEIRLYPIQ
jgi:NAD-dependent dihydropyrimidine dehydrogenase PreA subunit